MSTNAAHNCRDEEKTRSNIEKYGLSVIRIEATDYLPSFAYSIGLWEKYKHPEIICFGFSTETLHIIINDGADLVKSGISLTTDKIYDDFFKKNDVMFIEVASTYLVNYFGYAVDFYKTRNFPALQFVWTDRNNKFPWEENFEEEFIERQPLLDRNTDFKFREAKNLGILTTRQWLNQNKPIIRVIHDSEGDWQFLTGDQILADACLVALEQMVIRDPTLNEIFNLDYGEFANRSFIGDVWERGAFEYEADDDEAD